MGKEAIWATWFDMEVMAIVKKGLDGDLLVIAQSLVPPWAAPSNFSFHTTRRDFKVGDKFHLELEIRPEPGEMPGVPVEWVDSPDN